MTQEYAFCRRISALSLHHELPRPPAKIPSKGETDVSARNGHQDRQPCSVELKGKPQAECCMVNTFVHV